MGLRTELARLKWSFASDKKKQKLLDEACAFLRLWPETAALLDLAAAQGVGIRFDPALDGTDTDGLLHRNRQTGECFIALKPNMKPDEIAIPLIHELRHLWQEQQLGLTPGTAGLGEKDIHTALLLTRVKEADAFAFTNLMINRINHAQQDYIDARGLPQDDADQFLADRIQARLPAEKQKMADDFRRELGDLDSYDRIAVRDYFRRYVSPTGPALRHLTEKDGHVLGVADLRRILQTGTFDIMPPYLDALDDKALAETVLSGTKPDIRETITLIDAFEKSTRAGTPAASLTRQQQDIATRLAKLQP